MPAQQPHPVCPQYGLFIQHDVGPQPLADRDIIDTESEFFAQFASQRGRLGLAVSNLSAGKLPSTSQLRRPDPLRHQYGAAADDGSGNNDLIRLIRHRQ
ncbi:hypothetical protein MSHO_14870 [Mycobacterium shottsii]|uniref:Uncharacterized protein n=1 Tax=Mycobacterium shottsii TaxID=133549 RepID=A0A7I7L9H1_9MYCO|nr:hypothetical protein MSHO_14870 [Mycobacterium shottsii]